jgi:membrane-associated phospholipid phosphatase
MFFPVTERATLDREEANGGVTVIAVVLVVGVIAAAIATSIASRIPAFDPAAPRASVRAVDAEVRGHPRLQAYLRSRVDPTTATGLALTVALSIVVSMAIATGLLLVMARHNAGLAHYDLSAARWGASHATSGSTRFLRDVSLLGGTLITLYVSVAAAIVEYLRTRTAAVFAFMTTVVLSHVIVMNLTKAIVGRPRPDILRLTGFSGSSFPSGHATAAAATYSAVALLVGRGRTARTKSFLAGAAAGIAASVAASRVLLGVHWFTDVLAGLAVGWACFALSSIAFGGRVLDFGNPVQVAESRSEAMVAERE